MNPGDKLGHFEIVGPLGAGGMGEVYQATDTRLKRDVAIKVLPAELSADPERLARLEREAQLLAQLEHPNVAGVYGLEEADQVRFLVMQLVEGETLADRLDRDAGDGRAGGLPITDALDIAVQIGAGLEAAHARGIIHRDLKPANVMLAGDGGVKILDFGLAKPFGDDGSTLSGDMSASPTMLAATRSGMILGTAGYMSPEQARGKEVDKRTDIWAFGCVLYEMLAGRRPFDGETVSDVMASILKESPSFGPLEAVHGPRLIILLRRCLTKDPGKRLHDVADARIELADLAEHPDELALGVASAVGTRAPLAVRLAPWVIAAVGVVFGLWAYAVGERATGRGRMEIGIPVGSVMPFLDGDAPSVAIAHDGSTIAYVATPVEYAQRDVLDRQVIHVRRLDQPESLVLEGTEGGFLPFFSPDGQWLGFFSRGSLRKIPVGGGPVVTICAAPNAYGAAWLQDGNILFTPTTASAIWRVADAADSTPERVSTLDAAAGENEHDWPYVLPGGGSALFTIWRGGSWPDSDIGLLDLATGDHRIVQGLGSYPAYVAPGYLVYGRPGQLFAVHFDPETGEASGTPVAVASGILTTENPQVSQFAVSPEGTLVYAPGGRAPPAGELVWLEPDGQITPADPEGRFPSVAFLTISPDGGKLAIVVSDDRFDIHVVDIETGAVEVVANDPAWETAPVWSPDGRQIAYSSAHEGTLNLYTVDLEGNRSEALLEPTDKPRFALAWQDRWLAYMQEGGEGGRPDIWLLDLEGNGTSVPMATSRARENDAGFSPDGRWVAFVTDVSGRPEVHVSPMPPTGESWQVSRGGGSGVSAWTADGLIYYNPEARREMLVPIDDNGRGGQPEPFTAPDPERFVGMATDPQTGRAIGFMREPVPEISWLVVWPGWNEELHRLMSGGR